MAALQIYDPGERLKGLDNDGVDGQRGHGITWRARVLVTPSSFPAGPKRCPKRPVQSVYS